MDTLYACVETIINRWPTFNSALEHDSCGVGTRDKVQWFPSAIVQWFQENKNCDRYDVEDLLIDILDNEFDLLIEDGSISVVALQLCKVYEDTSSGRLKEAHAFAEAIPKQKVNCVQKQDVAGETSDEEELQIPTASCTQSMQVASNVEEPMEDENSEDDDGWTTVKRRKQKR